MKKLLVAAILLGQDSHESCNPALLCQGEGLSRPLLAIAKRLWERWHVCVTGGAVGPMMTMMRWLLVLCDIATDPGSGC
jgi:hypothetical protein